MTSIMWRLAAIFCALLALSEPTQATLIALDDPTFGPDSLVLDTGTGLEWLNLRFAFGESLDRVLADLQPGGRFAGFRYASEEELNTLGSDFFFSASFPAAVLDLTTTENFISLLFAQNSNLMSGFLTPFLGFPPDILDVCEATVSIGGPSDHQFGTIDEQCSFGGGGSALSSFLIRAVPEPASVWLLALGLFGVGLMISLASGKPKSSKKQSRLPRPII